MITLLNGVSFIICTYNSAAHIEETLRCLAQQQIPAGAGWEVVLVDNACTDGTAAEAERCWKLLAATAPLRILSEPRPGKNFAVELAFQQARYQYACIVDDDNRLASNYLATGYALLEAHPEVAILGGRNTGAFEVPPPAWFADFQRCYAVGVPLSNANSEAVPLPAGDIGPNVLWGAGMFIRVKLWRQMQDLGFRSLFAGRKGTKNLTAGEDDEICFVARLLGYEVWYSPNLVLEHYMVAGRLKLAYRDKLFYSPAPAVARLAAYRSALAKGRAADPRPTLTLVKDFLYMVWGTTRQLLAGRTWRALWTGDTLPTMALKFQLLTILNYVLNFGQIIGYYKSVDYFKQIAVQAGYGPKQAG